MPTYLPARLGIQQSRAYAEAAHFGTEEPVFFTLAFYHPLIRGVGGNEIAIYVVNDFEPLDATIEVGAPLDGGSVVTFQPVPMQIRLANETGESSTGTVEITISNVSRLLMPYLEKVVLSADPIYVICRVYLGNDLSGPHEMPPLKLVLQDAVALPSSVTATAGFGFLTNRKFPGGASPAPIEPPTSTCEWGEGSWVDEFTVLPALELVSGSSPPEYPQLNQGGLQWVCYGGVGTLGWRATFADSPEFTDRFDLTFDYRHSHSNEYLGWLYYTWVSFNMGTPSDSLPFGDDATYLLFQASTENPPNNNYITVKLYRKVASSGTTLEAPYTVGANRFSPDAYATIRVRGWDGNYKVWINNTLVFDWTPGFGNAHWSKLRFGCQTTNNNSSYYESIMGRVELTYCLPEPEYYGALLSLYHHSLGGPPGDSDYRDPIRSPAFGGWSNAAQHQYYEFSHPNIMYVFNAGGLMDADYTASTFNRTYTFTRNANTWMRSEAYENDASQDYASHWWQLLDADGNNVFKFEVTGDKNVSGTNGYGNRAYYTIDNNAPVELGSTGGPPPYASVQLMFKFTDTSVIAVATPVSNYYVNGFTASGVRMTEAVSVRVGGGRAYISHNGINLFHVLSRVSYFPDGYPPGTPPSF